MTDRINSFLVVLEQNIRIDDAESLITAISLLKGVLSVTPNVSNGTEFIAEDRARSKLIDEIWRLLHDKT